MYDVNTESGWGVEVAMSILAQGIDLSATGLSHPPTPFFFLSCFPWGGDSVSGQHGSDDLVFMGRLSVLVTTGVLALPKMGLGNWLPLRQSEPPIVCMSHFPNFLNDDNSVCT